MKTTQNINADVAALPRPGFSSHSDDLKSRLQFSSMTDGGVRKPIGAWGWGPRWKGKTCNMPTVESCALWLVLIRETFAPSNDGLRFQRDVLWQGSTWSLIVQFRKLFDTLSPLITYTNMQTQICLAKWYIPTGMHESWWNFENNKRRS